MDSKASRKQAKSHDEPWLESTKAPHIVRWHDTLRAQSIVVDVAVARMMEAVLDMRPYLEMDRDQQSDSMAYDRQSNLMAEPMSLVAEGKEPWHLGILADLKDVLGHEDACIVVLTALGVHTRSRNMSFAIRKTAAAALHGNATSSMAQGYHRGDFPGWDAAEC